MSTTNDSPPDQRLVYPAIYERDGLKVSQSPWGKDDEIGRLNWITPESRKAILESLDGSQVFDLAVEYFVGMPSWVAGHDPKYDIWMTHTPRGSLIDPPPGTTRELLESSSYSGDAITMYTHCGTHIDTLNHAGHFGCVWNGFRADEHLGSRHWMVGGAEKYPNIIARGVLLDFAGAHGVDCLPDVHAIGAEEIRRVAAHQGVKLRRGDVVLIRTGRMTRWPDFDGYLLNTPGLTVEGARYLCEEAGAMIVGSDAISPEVLPSEDPGFLPVHAYLLATAGAQIMEVCWLEELAAERQYEFAFLAGCLKLRGATGSPLRPMAIPLRG